MEYSFTHKLEKVTDDYFFSKINNGSIRLNSNGCFILNHDYHSFGNFTFNDSSIIFEFESKTYSYEILDNRVDLFTLKKNENIMVFYRPC